MSGIGHNSAAFGIEPDEEPTIDVGTAEIVKRVVEALAAALGMTDQRGNVLKKKQAFKTLSLRQLTVWCLTDPNPDLGAVPVVKLAKIIGFDRGTVRDDRLMVEKAAAEDREGYLQEFLESAREMVLSIPSIANGTPLFHVCMDAARAKTRANLRKQRARKTVMMSAYDQPTRGEIALRELGKHDLADALAAQRKERQAPWNPASDKRPEWVRQ